MKLLFESEFVEGQRTGTVSSSANTPRPLFRDIVSVLVLSCVHRMSTSWIGYAEEKDVSKRRHSSLYL